MGKPATIITLTINPVGTPEAESCHREDVVRFHHAMSHGTEEESFPYPPEFE